MRRDDGQFLALLRQEQGKLFRIARAITGQEADAWDMVQEATLLAYDRFSQLRGGPSSFGPWIRRILVNRCHDLLKARMRIVPLDGVLDGDPDPQPGPEEQMDHSLLWGEVMALEAHHRQALVLRFLVDMPVPEMAALLDVPEGTVKSRLHRALSSLRKRLESREEGVVTQA